MAYTGWLDVKAGEGAEAMDIPSMRGMTVEQYTSYIRDHVLYMDHHEVLRSSFCDYPYATTPEQVDAFIEVLKHYRRKMIE